MWGENVPVLMRTLSALVGYRYDSSDEIAVEFGLPSTDADADDRWFDYPLVGQPIITVWLAQNVGAEPVSVRVVGDMDPVLAARVDTAIGVMADIRSR